MAAAMEVVGNPSSVHAEGRAAKALMERARAQIAAALGADGADIVFTRARPRRRRWPVRGPGAGLCAVEHDAVAAWCAPSLPVDGQGRVAVWRPGADGAATGEFRNRAACRTCRKAGLAVSDLTQAFGKVPLAFNWLGCEMGLVSAHKLGGPKGIGALVVRQGIEVPRS
jgi:cysteine desulfurase